MRRGRTTTGLVLGAFSAALTVLPWLHTLHHRDDHVHVDGAIVFVGVEHEHEHEHEHVYEHEDDDSDEGAPGFDHPAHHGSHGRGALAHGAAFILAGVIYVLPQPGVAIERLPVPSLPDRPALAAQRSPRVTRGPPRAGVVLSSSLLVAQAG
jgi:hypothetical protein